MVAKSCCLAFVQWNKKHLFSAADLAQGVWPYKMFNCHTTDWSLYPQSRLWLGLGTFCGFGQRSHFVLSEISEFFFLDIIKQVLVANKSYVGVIETLVVQHYRICFCNLKLVWCRTLLSVLSSQKGLVKSLWMFWCCTSPLGFVPVIPVARPTTVQRPQRVERHEDRYRGHRFCFTGGLCLCPEAHSDSIGSVLIGPVRSCLW